MAITNYDGIIAARAAGKADDVFTQKASVGWVKGDWHSYVMVAGQQASATYAAATSGGAILSNTMRGAIPFKSCTGTDSKYLLSFAAGGIAGPEAAAFGLIDILWAGSSFLLNSSATQAINSPELTRSTDGRYNKLGVMKRSTSSTANTVTAWYTDAGGTATSVNVVITTAGASGRLLPTGYLGAPIPNGIKSIQSAQAQTAQTAGIVDLMIFRVLDVIPAIGQYTWVEKDMTAQIDGLLQLDIDSSKDCGYLSPVVLAAGASGRPITFMIRTCAG